MRSIIDELYYGNVVPADRSIVKGGEYSDLLRLLNQNAEKLQETLTQAQNETFEKFQGCASEINDSNEVAAFTLGFKLGLRITAEAMMDSRELLEPRME